MIVNAIRASFIKSYVEDDRKAKRSRLAELDKSYKETQKELGKVRKELAAAGRPMETDSLDAGRLEEFQKQKARAEVELVAARSRLANLQANPPQEKTTKLDEEQLDALVDKFANRDRKILELAGQSDRAHALYPRDRAHLFETLQAARVQRRHNRTSRPFSSPSSAASAACVPELEKLIRERTEEKAPAEDPVDNARREVLLYESQLKELSKRVQDQVAAKNVLQESRRNLASTGRNRRAKTQDVERLERVSQITFSEAEAIRKELNGAVAAVAVDEADHVELLPVDESRGMKMAGLAGLAVFCVVVGGVSYREHLQHRIHHSDDVVHELSLPLLANTPALSERLDLFNAVLEESQTNSPFAERCRAIDGICPFVMHEAEAGQARIIMVTGRWVMKGKVKWPACWPTAWRVPGSARC